MAEKTIIENPVGNSPIASDMSSLNAQIRTYCDDPGQRLRAFALWSLQAQECLCSITALCLHRGWHHENAHTKATSDVHLEFSMPPSLRTLTRALVGWCDHCGPKIDLVDMPTFVSQLLAWSVRTGAYGPPAPLNFLEETLAAAMRAIDRVDVVTGFQTRRREILEGPFGLWATDDFETVGRSGYEATVRFAGSPTLISAFKVCFLAQGRRVTPTEFDKNYDGGECSAKYETISRLKGPLEPLGITIKNFQLIDLKKEIRTVTKKSTSRKKPNDKT